MKTSIALIIGILIGAVAALTYAMSCIMLSVRNGDFER